jgi:hypothetical protein
VTIPAAVLGAQVTAFEMLGSNIALLEQSVRRNDLSNIRIVCGALSDRPGFLGTGGTSAWAMAGVGGLVPHAVRTDPQIVRLLEEWQTMASDPQLDILRRGRRKGTRGATFSRGPLHPTRATTRSGDVAFAEDHGTAAESSASRRLRQSLRHAARVPCGPALSRRRIVMHDLLAGGVHSG